MKDSEPLDRPGLFVPEPAPSPTDASDAIADQTSELRQLLAEAKRGEQEARQTARLFKEIIDLMPVGLTVQSEDGTVFLANDLATQFCGPVTAIGGAPCREDLPSAAESGAAKATRVETTTEELGGQDGDRTLLRCSRPARVLGRSLVLTASVDFTARKRTEVELSKRAYFDDLTGLPNRVLIQEHVDQLIADSSGRFALAFLDIDDFKHINDYYTHAIGDALLVKVAQRIAAYIRPSDILSRISGDEFILVLNPIDQIHELTGLIDTLIAQLKEPFLIEGFEIFTSALIGVSIHPDHGHSYEILRRAADTAMYRIKQRDKGGAVLFDAEMGRAVTARMGQEQRLRLAVRDGRFCCAFQPKVDIRSKEVVGVEALIRLRDENGEIHAPGDFIGLATRLGLIDAITNMALHQIISSMDLIDDAFGPQATVSINIAAKQACNLRFMHDFCATLKTTERADRFMIEVTEDAFVAKSLFQEQILPMIREIGARVSIDDFWHRLFFARSTRRYHRRRT